MKTTAPFLRGVVRAVGGAACILCGAATAQAEEMKANAFISGDVLRQARGAAMVNQAAGDGLLQSNAAAVALNRTGKAISRSVAVQRTAARDGDAAADLEVDAVALIGGRAFSEAQGIISVTQGAGRNNLQVNTIAAGLGLAGEVLVEAELSQSRAGPSEPAAVDADGARAAIVTNGAFRDAQGLVQVNQVAGQANSTYNRFALGVSAGLAP